MGTENGVSNGDNTECAEQVQRLKSVALHNGVAIADGNYVTEEAQHLKSKAMNNGVAFADGNGVTQEAGLLKSEAVSNGEVAMAVSADGDFGGLECLRTYKRRKHVKSSSKSKVQGSYIERVEAAAASHVANQVVKEPCDVALGNAADDYSHGHWGKVVLKHLYQSLGDGNGGIEGCIREALIHHPKISCATTLTEAFKIDKDGQECSSQFDCLSHRTRNEANGHANVMRRGCSSEPNGHGVTEMSQRVLCNILTSEKFSSLCKVLLENFQGMKPENVFDFSVMNSRMKEQAYEQSPTLFLSDIQQVWRKLQNAGNEIVALTKSLSNMSRISYCELVGISAEGTYEDEKQVFFNRESDSHMKPEQTEECATYKICSCRHCGDKADGTDCLVCDSCEEMYHLSCIQPPVREIPHKSWYCANCTASGIGSPHEDCVVCERLNDAKTLDNIVGGESFPMNEEALHEFEENSNCTYDGIQVSIGGKETPNCKMCGDKVDCEKIKICGHPFCSSKYYHVRCLTSKQLKSYGRRWYCPSCLCGICLTDRDDDQIVLCDGCDHAYHTYCMKPPRTSIPKGKWFCKKCDAGIKAIRRAKNAYESKKPRTGEDVSKLNANLEKKCSNKGVQELERGGGMDMLLTAANTLNFEENLASTQTESRRT
ncbi:Zinc finger, PHD-type [Sesbania bispinosa]|nr:Zinc finger, PHD-type [Sesbania bispinosa]